MAINWGLLQQPDIAGNALTAFNQGRQQGQERATRNALTAYAQDPSQIGQVIAADPAMGIQLQRQNEEAKQRAAADLRTEDAATREQHRVSTVRFLQALRAVPPEQRARRAQELFQQNEMGWTPEQVWQNASLLAQNPQRLTDEGLNSALAIVSGDVAPTTHNRPITAGGNVYVQTPDGSVKEVASSPRSAPAGMQWNADQTALEPIPGYLEGQSALTAARRQAVNANPAPPRARASGGGHSGGRRRSRGGGGHAGGSAPAQGGNPWDRDY